MRIISGTVTAPKPSRKENGNYIVGPRAALAKEPDPIPRSIGSRKLSTASPIASKSRWSGRKIIRTSLAEPVKKMQTQRHWRGGHLYPLLFSGHRPPFALATPALFKH